MQPKASVFMTKMYSLTVIWLADPDPRLLDTIANQMHMKIRPGGVLMYKGNKSSGSFGEAALPRAFFAPPLFITLFLTGLESVSLDIASEHMATLRAFLRNSKKHYG